MNPDDQEKVIGLNLTARDKLNVTECYEKIIRSIVGPNIKTHSRARLFQLKQEPKQSISKYASEVEKLASLAYGADEEGVKERIMKDCFLTGLRDGLVAYDVMKQKPRDYRSAREMALELEAMIAATKPLNGVSDSFF